MKADVCLKKRTYLLVLWLMFFISVYSFHAVSCKRMKRKAPHLPTRLENQISSKQLFLFIFIFHQVGHLIKTHLTGASYLNGFRFDRSNGLSRKTRKAEMNYSNFPDNCPKLNLSDDEHSTKVVERYELTAVAYNTKRVGGVHGLCFSFNWDVRQVTSRGMNLL